MRIALALLVCPAILLGAKTLHAQAGPGSLEFSFSNPGARSMGFGGAFVALADDATAAFANPSGLVQLIRPEVSIEGRFWSYSIPFTLGGRLDGPATGIGLDTEALRTGVTSATLSSLSFLSFVYPGSNWAVAFYRHQLANFEAATETQGFFSDTSLGQRTWVCCDGVHRQEDFRRWTDFEIVTYGVSGAYRPTERFSAGIGITYFDGSFLDRTEFFEPQPQTLPQGFFGKNAYAPEALIETNTAILSSSDWGFNVGFLWNVSSQLNLGGSYRQGPEFGGSVEDRSGPALAGFIPEGTVFNSSPWAMSFPDVFGLGASFKSQSGAITVSGEWDLVRYGIIIDSVRDTPTDVEDIVLDDASELHFGFEYAFIRSTPIVALRFGTWLDPDHRLRYVGDDPIQQAVFRGGEDEWHFAVGFGLAFGRFQFDLGIDMSDLVDTVSASAIVSF